MRYASVDIGTNTLRLLIAEAGGRGVLNPVIYKRIITRLGGGYTEKSGISPLAAERAFKALEEFKALIEGSGAAHVTAVATSVVRRAINREWFLKEAQKRAGLEIKVITGEEEARTTLRGVLSVAGEQKRERLVMDIGGGSTEFIICNGGDIKGLFSMDMGVVHLVETYVKSDPPKKDELQSMENEIDRVIENLKANMKEGGISPLNYSKKSGAEFIGTAGTITTLAAIDQDMDSYDRGKINNYALSRASVERIYAGLIELTLKQREKLLTLEKGREDIIIPGAKIVLRVMDSFGFDSIRVSDAGLLEGVIIEEAALPQA